METIRQKLEQLIQASKAFALQMRLQEDNFSQDRAETIDNLQADIEELKKEIIYMKGEK